MNKVILTLILFVALAACGRSGSEQGDPTARLETLRKEQATLSEKIRQAEEEIAKKDPNFALKGAKDVQVVSLQPEVFKSYIQVQGTVDARQNVDVSSKMPGSITQILVREGQSVSKGQTLATIDDEMIRKGMDELQTQLRFVTDIYQKQKSLWDQKIGTEIQYLTAKNNKVALEQKMASLQEQYDMTRIKSPIGGTVETLNVKLGQTVAPGFPAFKVVNLGDMRIVAGLAESYVGRVRVGTPVLVKSTNSEQEIPMRVDFVGKVIDQLNRTFKVEVALRGNQGLFKPNMLASLRINDLTQNNVILVPLNVVQSSGTEKYVLVAEERSGKTYATKRVVTTGLTSDGKTVIEQGLKAGERLISNGFSGLNDGQLIKLAQ